MAAMALRVFLLVLTGAALAAGQGVDPAKPRSDVAPATGDARESLGTYEVLRGQAYVVRDGNEIKLDLYRPDGPGRPPLVLLVHGGGWRMGSRGMGEAPAIAKALAVRGFAVACPSYRLAPAHPHPAQLDDCRRALQWVRNEAERLRIDGGRAAGVGASAGGHLAALLGTLDEGAKPESPDPVERQSTRFRAIAVFCTPFDLTPDPEVTPTAGQLRIVADFLGVKDVTSREGIDAAMAKARAASPRTWLSAGDPPLFMVHGDDDGLVPLGQARRMMAGAAALDVPAELVVIPGGGHGEWMGKIWEADAKTAENYWARTVAFLRKHLGVEKTQEKAQ